VKREPRYKSLDQVTRRDGQANFAPNHSWRHRFNTLGRRNGLAVDILDAMTGHGRKTVADTYGDFPPEAMLRELTKIPTLKP
jgi:integrase